MKLLTLLIAGSLLLQRLRKKEHYHTKCAWEMRISDAGACRVLIELSSGQLLFPTNLDKLQSFLTNGRKVTVSYRHDGDFVSPCSGSEPALIESIR